MKKIGKIFIISAPTGVGKTTISAAVLEKISSEIDMRRVITYTTRPPRSGEINGKDYFFIKNDDFLAKKEAGFFLETNFYDDHWYGSPASILHDLDHGISYLMVVDRSGALSIAQKNSRVALIWLTVSDFAMIEKRLLDRGNTQPERLQIAMAEWHAEQQCPIFTYHITNDDGHFDQAVEKVCMVMRGTLRSKDHH